jgi:non-canonical purine NTP pyrophosphatase (RdgB/HAM1 family)
MKTFDHITFITGNAGKIKEMQALMPGINICNLDVPEIQEIDAIKVVQAKLEAAYKHVQGPVIVDDTSLYLDYFNQQLPGPFIKWFLKSMKNSGLADMARRLGNCNAHAKTIIGFAKNSDEMFFFEGSLPGTIVQPENSPSLGWDAIFRPTGAPHTFAAMDVAQKNKISMRAQAVAKLVAFLQAQT